MPSLRYALKIHPLRRWLQAFLIPKPRLAANASRRWLLARQGLVGGSRGDCGRGLADGSGSLRHTTP